MATGLAKKSKTMRLALFCSRPAKPRSRLTDLRRPGSSALSASACGKSARSTTGTAASRCASSPSSLGVIATWCGPRRPRMVIVRIAAGEDHRVIEVEQLGDGDVAADGDVADEVDAGALGDLVVALADRLQRLVVGRDPEADQAIRNRIAVEDVDARLFAIGLLQRLGGVEARRTRTDHREMPHVPSRFPVIASVAKHSSRGNWIASSPRSSK